MAANLKRLPKMEKLTQEELARIHKTARETSQALAKSMQLLAGGYSQQLAKSMQLLAGGYYQHLAKNMQLLQKQLISPILQAQIAAISKIVAPIQRLQQPLLRIIESERQRKRVTVAFQECNLWLAPSMIELCEQITQLHYEGKKQVIPSIISRHYKKNDWAVLKKAVNNWKNNRFFRPRMGIVLDALDAHIDGKYTLSVPALLPHIEGIALDIIKKYDIPKLDKPLIFTKDTYDSNGVVTSPSRVFAQVAATFSFEEFIAIESFLYYLERTLYFSPHGIRKGLKTLKKESQLNRHAILHGVQIKYATPMNSLRCFLALDVLSLINDDEGKPSE